MARTESTVRLLTGNLVLRRPDRAQLATRTPLVLTDRDADILTAVYQHRFLTTDLIARMFFPEQNGERRSESTCAYDRIRQLWLWRYLERIEQPVAPSIGGRCPLLYALATRGAPLVQARLGPGAARVRPVRFDEANVFATLKHDLRAAALRAGLHETLRGTGVGLTWCAEHELARRELHAIDPRTGQRLAFRPDGYFELAYPDGRLQCSLLELDTGSVHLPDFARKVRAFETFLATGQVAADLGRPGFDVWVVTSTPKRLDSLRRVTRRVVAASRRGSYLFATVGVVEPRRLADGGWTSLDRDVPGPFLAPDAEGAPGAGEAAE